MSFEPDLVAYSGKRNFADFPSDQVDMTINQIAAMLLSVDWTQEATGTMDGHPFFKLRSAQSPWFDFPNAPPPAYRGVIKVLIHAVNNNEVRFQPFNVDETATVSQAQFEPILSRISPAITYRIIACPYQFLVFAPSATSLPNANISVLVSTLHTQRFMQEAGMNDCMVACNFDSYRGNLVQANTPGQFHLVRFGLVDHFWSGFVNDQGRPRFKIPISGRANSADYSDGPCGIYNFEDDPGAADPAKSYGLLVPPLMAWGLDSGGAGPLFAYGHLWDSFLTSQQYGPGVIDANVDAHNFESLTDVAAYDSGLAARGTLWLANSPQLD